MSTIGVATNRDKQPPKETGEVIARGLAILHRAWTYALATHLDPWEFAVEVADLQRAGLSNSDMRWCLARELIEAAYEVTVPGEHHRSFRKIPFCGFTPQTCFVLTAVGMHFTAAMTGNGDRHMLDARVTMASGDSGPICQATDSCANHETLRPHWNHERKELCFGSAIVKRFRGPAINQETILAVFEEEGWPARIDDPLPVLPEQDPKRRLHDTIKCLNRNHKSVLIRFMGDGTGEGVFWMHAAEAANTGQ